MIIVKLMGGLGNQMFQYALGRHLAEIHKTELKLDLSLLLNSSDKNAVKCNYELENFNIKAEIATEEDLKFFFKTNKRFNFKKLKFIRVPDYQIFNEKQFNFDKSIFQLPIKTYLNGYFQSEKYFKNIEFVIRDEFKPKSDILHHPHYQTITKHNAISLHIRRKDYLHKNSIHLFCGLEYYQKAISFLHQKIKNPHFFIFSDEPEWGKKHLHFENEYTFVEPSSQAFVDMLLMSHCQHHIIANSSYSWWGAWLNPNLAKVILSPMHWFVPATINTEDLIPEQWLKIA